MMFRRFAALLLAFAVPASAAPFTPSAFRAHVTFLADDLLEGRETGTRGHEIAARYVAAQFAAAGLTPAGDDGGWFQRITFQQRSFGPRGATLTLTGAGGTQIWANGTEFTTSPSQFEAEQSVEAPVVFAGYGMTAPFFKFDDYAGLDVRGKVVAVLRGFPKGMPSEAGAHLQSQQARIAQEHGAIGIVVVPTIASSAAFPWEKGRKTATLPRMSWVEPDGHAHSEAATIKFSAGLSPVAAKALFAGAARSLDAVLAEADTAGGRPKGFALAATVKLQRSSVWQTMTSPNVLGMLRGNDPRLAAETVVLTAHVDHLGVRPSNAGDKIYNGAMDNAAGVATMIEVARGFQAAGKAPRRSVLFIGATGEEKGLLGADYFAHHPTAAAGTVVSDIDLDEPMLLYDFTDVNAFGAEHSTIGAVIARAAATMGVKVTPDPHPEQVIFVRSDHYPFVKAGIPALFLGTGYANGGAAAWEDYEAHHYHEPSDDLSLPFVWASGAKFAKLNYLVTRDLANAPDIPRWYKGDFFGETFAAGAAKAAR